ncbi:MAG TPA: tRNA (adenosine(37)-N6)-dimethylallyltransferase MiaA [Candidatus Saccharimonadales bacterium]|nr:tRNA (adenosine(37)-N6)-dimethylallyltransferase MiaA [Candidatus Saccharimonadales bacterium]
MKLKPPLLVVVGETASGKSALALELAEQFNGELICADSWTVYRGFDIATAKPTAEEQARVPHHLLDVADPVEGFSAVVFQRLANEAIVGIWARGRLPIMVGGTGLYVDSILYDYSFLPPSDPQLRSELNAQSLEDLLKRADELGLDTSGIDLRNKRRVIRLIENNGVRPSKHELRPNTLVLGIQTEREQLRERVTARVDDMLAAGLENEVRVLAQRYSWEAEPMKGIGYVEWRQYFAGEQSIDETRERIINATMNLAKRQRTWFKRNTSIQWVSDRSYAVDFVTTFLNKTN